MWGVICENELNRQRYFVFPEACCFYLTHGHVYYHYPNPSLKDGFVFCLALYAYWVQLLSQVGVVIDRNYYHMVVSCLHDSNSMLLTLYRLKPSYGLYENLFIRHFIFTKRKVKLWQREKTCNYYWNAVWGLYIFPSAISMFNI